MMIRAYRFRLYPNSLQAEALNHHLWLSKELWNRMLDYSKSKYTSEGKFASKKELRDMSKHQGLFSQVAQELVDRLVDATWRFVRMKKAGENCGFPRFKSFERLKSLCYPQMGFRLVGNRLKVTPFGEIKLKLHRQIKGNVKTLILKHESSGKWFAIFQCEEAFKPLPETSRVVGLDVGIKHFLSDSDGRQIENPKFYDTSIERLRKAHKILSRKKKGSKNRFKARIKLSRACEKVVNQRDDFLHKLSRFYVNNYGMIAVEDLNIKGMVRNHCLARKIQDASWSKFFSMLSYKAENAGRTLVKVNPRGTSREYKHGELDRDYNAALNILERGVGTTLKPVEIRPLLIEIPASVIVEAGSPHDLSVG
ncbi:transposase [Candidatus Bathyarchaeota archaeon]|nr:transposase [Candidatus Bathyarchaeota archaeon]